MLNDFSFYEFLALLCATEQQSYCHHAGIRGPSVKTETVFSVPFKQINVEFWGKVHFHHISRLLFFCFVLFLFYFSKFYIFDFLRYLFRFRYYGTNKE